MSKSNYTVYILQNCEQQHRNVFFGTAVFQSAYFKTYQWSTILFLFVNLSLSLFLFQNFKFALLVSLYIMYAGNDKKLWIQKDKYYIYIYVCMSV